jgi:hypothetical protein
VATKYFDSLDIHVPFVVDWDGLITQAFQMHQLPGIVLWKQNILRIRHSGKGWFDKVEPELQSILQESDPGLPLWLPFSADKLPFQGKGQLNFGREREIKYTGPGFKQRYEDGPWEGQYFPTDAPLSTQIGSIQLIGKWTIDDDRLITKDPDASITFKAPEATLGIIGQPLGKPDEHATIEIDLNEVSVPDIFSGTSLTYNDEGQSILRMKKLELFHVCTKMPKGERNIRLRFPYSSTTPVAIYGLRFAE